MNQLVKWGYDEIKKHHILGEGGEFDLFNILANKAKRVDVTGKISYDFKVSRKRSSFEMTDLNGGENIEVFYDKTDFVDFFMNNKIENRKVKVTGRVFVYNNSANIFIRAEKIEMLP